MTPSDRIEAILFDIGGTLVVEAPPGTPTGDLVVVLRPGVAADLAVLSRSCRLGAATNTAVLGEAEVRRLLTRAGIGAYFAVVVTSADVGAPKPDPAILLVASQQLSIESARILYVGDRSIDAQAAAAAGMRFADVGIGGLLDAVSPFLEVVLPPEN